MACDFLGLPVRMIITAGNRNDITQVDKLTQGFRATSQLEQFPKSVTRFSGKNCGKNKKIEQSGESNRPKTALADKGYDGKRALEAAKNIGATPVIP